mmetsp:Transcript_78286/g.138765  ORF Transcript_78286/g.138765 Transcript_78286/m.138765 type:complete len:828 (+) Transcript_78286:60-2543(+)
MSDVARLAPFNGTRLNPFNSTQPHPILSHLKPRLHLDDNSQEELAKWAAPEYAADPVDEARLRNSPPWQVQAAMMERAWLILACVAVLALLVALLRRLLHCRRRPECLGQSLQTFVRETLSVDSRALAMFRIYFAAVMLYDIAKQAWHLRILRTDQALFYGFYEPPDPVLGVCPHCVSPSFAWQAFMILVTLAVFISVMLGWHTTKVTLAACLLFRSMLVSVGDEWQQGCDRIANSYLFWSTLAPWGLRYSLDARRNKRAPCSSQSRQVLLQPGLPGDRTSRLHAIRKCLFQLSQAAGFREVPGSVSLGNTGDEDMESKSHSVLSGGVLGMFLSMLDLYWSCVSNRVGHDWTKDYSAVWNLFHDPSQTKPLGHFLAQFPWLCRLLCFVAMKAEFWCPCLLLTGGLLGGAARAGACFMMIGLHIGLGLAIPLGWFQAVTLAPWIAFLPPIVCDLFHAQLEHFGRAWASLVGVRTSSESAQATPDVSGMGKAGSSKRAAAPAQQASARGERETSSSTRRRQPHLAGSGSIKAIFTTAVKKDAASSAYKNKEIDTFMPTSTQLLRLMSLRGFVSLVMVAAFLLARFDYSPELYQFFTGTWGLEHTMHWKLYQHTPLVFTGKMTLVGNLANGAEVALNHHGFEASRRELLAYARNEQSAEDWFTFGDGLEGGHRMDTFIWPRQIRQGFNMLALSEHTRLMMLEFWCRRWNDEDGGVHETDPQRLQTIDWYDSVKLGMVDPTRGFMGVNNFRIQSRLGFRCNRSWQDHMRAEGFKEEDIRHAKWSWQHAQEEMKKGGRILVKQVRLIQKMMRNHQREGGKGQGKFHIDFYPQ